MKDLSVDTSKADSGSQKAVPIHCTVVPMQLSLVKCIMSVAHDFPKVTEFTINQRHSYVL